MRGGLAHGRRGHAGKGSGGRSPPPSCGGLGVLPPEDFLKLKRP